MKASPIYIRLNKMSEYPTSDLWLVATLLSYGFTYSSVNKDNPARQAFIFLRSPDLNRAIADHFSGALNVPSLLFKANYAQVLDIIKEKNERNS